MQLFTIIVMGVLVVGGYYIVVWPIFAIVIKFMKLYFRSFIKGYILSLTSFLILIGIAYITMPAHIGISLYVFVGTIGCCYSFFAVQYLFNRPLIGKPQWVRAFCNKEIVNIRDMRIGERFRDFGFEVFFVAATVAVILAGVFSAGIIMAGLLGIKLPVVRV